MSEHVLFPLVFLSQILLHKALLAIGSGPRLGYRGFGIADVEVYALLGDEEKAISTLAAAVQEGWRAR